MAAVIDPRVQSRAGDEVAAPAILVVEDDDAVREVTVAVLEDAGYSVHAVADGPRALAAVTTEPPALVLLDLSLPILDGWQVLEQLRAAAAAPPVVVLTGHSNLTDRALAAGAAAAVLKPFDIDELCGVIARVLASSDDAGQRRRLSDGQRSP